MDTAKSGSPARRRLSAVARTRGAVALLVGCALGLVGVAVVAQAEVPSGPHFFQVGHWVYNDDYQSAFHVDGSTGQVDAQAPVPGVERGSQVVQGARSGYVVERSRVTMFSTSTLSVDNAQTPPATEQPIAMEVAGGPYLVYRNAGQVVRLGDPVATVPTGGPLSRPVATADGTVWLHRIDTGSLCELPHAATQFACPAQLPPGHLGELTVVGDQPVVLDITAGMFRTVGKNGLGEPVPVGADLPSTVELADHDVDGRLAITDPADRKLLLIDTARLAGTGPVARPLTVDLPGDGRFAAPVTSEHTIALVDERTNEVLTYDGKGTRKGSTKVSGANGTPRLSRGEDTKMYVDSPDGSHVLVVNGGDGSILDAKVDLPGRGHTTGTGQPTGPGQGNRPGPSTGTGTGTPTAPPTEPTSNTPPPADRPVAAATPPGAPGDVAASAGTGSATVSWSAASANGSPVTAYTVSWPGGSTTVGGGRRSATLTGLATGKSYVFTVSAVNAAGHGPGSSASAVIPLGSPAGAPRVTAQGSAGGNVSVSWTAPDPQGATLVDYLVSTPGQADRHVSGLSTTYTGMTGTVTITVRAITRYGPPGSPVLTGAPGSARATVPAAPPTIKITSVVVGQTGFVVTVNADGKGSPSTCTADFNGATSAPVGCQGVTQLYINNVVYFGTITIKATIRNAQGLTATDSWVGSPGPKPAGGVVLWTLPVAALLGLRRRGKEDEAS